PLADVSVTFRPELGRLSYATTDADGKYTVQYTTEKPGALPGKHKVSISSEEEPDPDSDDPEKQKGSKERVPRKYNTQTMLEVEVSHENREPINFDLQSS
ncbi:MAG: Ig-like domain-containing protein, partial [Pirellulaceae bacterium]